MPKNITHYQDHLGMKVGKFYKTTLFQGQNQAKPSFSPPASKRGSFSQTRGLT